MSSGIPMNFEEWQYRMRLMKDEDRRKKTQTAEMLRDYRGGIKEDDLKLSAIRNEDRRKQQDAERLMHSYQCKTVEIQQRERPNRQELSYPPLTPQSEKDVRSMIAEGYVLERKANYDSPLKTNMIGPFSPSHQYGGGLSSSRRSGSNSLDSENTRLSALATTPFILPLFGEGDEKKEQDTPHVPTLRKEYEREYEDLALDSSSLASKQFEENSDLQLSGQPLPLLEKCHKTERQGDTSEPSMHFLSASRPFETSVATGVVNDLEIEADTIKGDERSAFHSLERHEESEENNEDFCSSPSTTQYDVDTVAHLQCHILHSSKTGECHENEQQISGYEHDMPTVSAHMECEKIVYLESINESTLDTDVSKEIEEEPEAHDAHHDLVIRSDYEKDCEDSGAVLRAPSSNQTEANTDTEVPHQALQVLEAEKCSGNAVHEPSSFIFAHEQHEGSVTTEMCHESEHESDANRVCDEDIIEDHYHGSKPTVAQEQNHIFASNEQVSSKFNENNNVSMIHKLGSESFVIDDTTRIAHSSENLQESQQMLSSNVDSHVEDVTIPCNAHVLKEIVNPFDNVLAQPFKECNPFDTYFPDQNSVSAVQWQLPQSRLSDIVQTLGGDCLSYLDANQAPSFSDLREMSSKTSYETANLISEAVTALQELDDTGEFYAEESQFGTGTVNETRSHALSEIPSQLEYFSTDIHHCELQDDIPGNKSAVRLDVNFSFGLITAVKNPNLHGYMLAVGKIVKSSLNKKAKLGVIVDIPFVNFTSTNDGIDWDDCYVDPFNRRGVRRALVSACVPITIFNGISSIMVRNEVIAALQHSIKSGHFLKLARRLEKHC